MINDTSVLRMEDTDYLPPDANELSPTDSAPALPVLLPSSQTIPTRIKISDITMDERLRVREVINDEKVAEYAGAMQSGVKLPPITLFREGDCLWLADGSHRITAAKAICRDEIDAEVRPGTLATALDFALLANASHGLPRSSADKRRAVRLALAAYCDRSDHVIAELCAVGHQLVASVRAELGDSSSSPRRGRDNKVRRLPKPKSVEAPVEPVIESDVDAPEHIDGSGAAGPSTYRSAPSPFPETSAPRSEVSSSISTDAGSTSRPQALPEEVGTELLHAYTLTSGALHSLPWDLRWIDPSVVQAAALKMEGTNACSMSTRQLSSTDLVVAQRLFLGFAAVVADAAVSHPTAHGSLRVLRAAEAVTSLFRGN